MRGHVGTPLPLPGKLLIQRECAGVLQTLYAIEVPGHIDIHENLPWSERAHAPHRVRLAISYILSTRQDSSSLKLIRMIN